MGSSKKKSFDELMEEFQNASDDFISGRIGEKALVKRKLKIIQQATKIAKNDHEKLIVNAHWLQLKQDYSL